MHEPQGNSAPVRVILVIVNRRVEGVYLGTPAEVVIQADGPGLLVLLVAHADQAIAEVLCQLAGATGVLVANVPGIGAGIEVGDTVHGLDHVIAEGVTGLYLP